LVAFLSFTAYLKNKIHTPGGLLMDLKKRATQLKTDIPAVFLSLKSKDTPLVAKILAGITIGYALSPIDLIPDFIPVLGYLDDLLILPALVALTIHLIPPDTFARFRQEAEGMWQNGKPKKWYYAIPIVVVWLVVLWLVVKAVFLR
jgi:uncharacterized membrane protein YkvA (DUF1232 family)